MTRPAPERRLPVLPRVAALFVLMVIGPGHSGSADTVSEVQRLGVEILSERPHDAGAFTQGLLWHDGSIYESTGQYGESTIRQVDPETGEVLKSRALSDEHFGEGLARVGEQLIQLTWNAGVAYVWDLASLDLVETRHYGGKGWGLCFDGESLLMSDGTPQIARRDPETLAVLETLEVRLDGRPVPDINELEFAEGWLYANVWRTDWVIRIDPSSGEVVALIDASPLRDRLGPATDPDAVLNGIAYLPETATFLLTGKNWPSAFEVIFVE